MPRIPYSRQPMYPKGMYSKEHLIEVAKYFNYDKLDKHRQFEARARMTISQLVEFGGILKLEGRMEEILDHLGIIPDEFIQSQIGWRPVEGQPTEFGSWIVDDKITGNVYRGSLKNVWR